VSNLLTLAGPGATIVAAVAAVFVTWKLGQGQLAIARQQAEIAKQQASMAAVRLQHDLFEKRIAVFNAAKDLILEVFHNSNVSDEAWNAFMRGTETAVFLFDKSVTDYITELRNRGSVIRGVVAHLADQQLPRGSERDEFARIRSENFNWFVAQFEVIIPKFMGALALEQAIDTRLPKPT